MAVTVKQYSLLDYSLSITLKQSTTATTGTSLNIPIGGAGKYLGSIKFTKSTDNITKTVDATGAGVFSFSNDHSGQVEITISQVSDAINSIITNISEKYHSDGSWKNALVDIIMTKGSKTVIEATNCMLVKMPDFSVENEVGTRSFMLLAMEIRETGFIY